MSVNAIRTLSSDLHVRVCTFSSSLLFVTKSYAWNGDGGYR